MSPCIDLCDFAFFLLRPFLQAAYSIQSIFLLSHHSNSDVRVLVQPLANVYGALRMYREKIELLRGDIAVDELVLPEYFPSKCNSLLQFSTAVYQYVSTGGAGPSKTDLVKEALVACERAFSIANVCFGPAHAFTSFCEKQRAAVDTLAKKMRVV